MLGNVMTPIGSLSTNQLTISTAYELTCLNSFGTASNATSTVVYVNDATPLVYKVDSHTTRGGTTGSAYFGEYELNPSSPTTYISWFAPNDPDDCDIKRDGVNVAHLTTNLINGKYSIPSIEAITDNTIYSVECFKYGAFEGQGTTTLLYVPKIPKPLEIECDTTNTSTPRAIFTWANATEYRTSNLRVYPTPPTSPNYPSALGPDGTAVTVTGSSYSRPITLGKEYEWYLEGVNNNDGNWSDHTMTPPFRCLLKTPTLSVSTKIMNFGGVMVNNQGTLSFPSTNPITVTNIGEGVLTGGLTFNLGTNYSCASASGGLCNFSLSGGQSQQFTLTFSPTTINPSITDIGTLSSNGGTEFISLTGAGVSVTTPGGLDFGRVVVGKTKDNTFTVKNQSTNTNVGSGTLVITPPFSCVDSSIGMDVGNNCMYSLAPGAMNIFTIRYAPTVATTSAETVTLSGSTAGSFLFTGVGIPQSFRMKEH
jgi:hypothetical protein